MYDKIVFIKFGDYFMTTLQNFEVSIARIIQPKIMSRFRVFFAEDCYCKDDDYKYLGLTQQVENCQRPAFVRNGIKLVANGSLEIVLRDDILNAASSLCNSLYESVFDIKLECFDGSKDHNVLDTWFYKDCNITNISYGMMDYKTSHYCTIDLTLRYRDAVQYFPS